MFAKREEEAGLAEGATPRTARRPGEDAHEALGAAMVVMEFSTRHDKPAGTSAEAGRLGDVVAEPEAALDNDPETQAA